MIAVVMLMFMFGLLCSALGLALLVVARERKRTRRSTTPATTSTTSAGGAVDDLVGGSGATSIGGSFPERVFSPYWDTSVTVDWKACPAKFITLAFVLADSAGKPAWNGSDPISSRKALVNDIRRAGKEVIVSFGGQAGTELGQSLTDVGKLADAYLSVINELGLTWIDLDIEGSTTADTAAVTRRHKAVAKVQKAKPDVIVSYTLPVMPTGLSPTEVEFLKLAKKEGVRVDVVNIMTMDYGESFTGDMGKYAIDAAKKTRAQLQEAGLPGAKVGICPMIGVNDVRAEVFTLANAKAVLEFARQNSWVRWLAFWSINRDNSSMSTELWKSSGVKQKDWEYSSTFAKFG